MFLHLESPLFILADHARCWLIFVLFQLRAQISAYLDAPKHVEVLELVARHEVAKRRDRRPAVVMHAGVPARVNVKHALRRLLLLASSASEEHGRRLVVMLCGADMVLS